jgi:hypothetical protein
MSPSRFRRSTSAPAGSGSASLRKSENVAWHVATTLLGRTKGMARPGELPDWARPRTGNSDGHSAGLIFRPRRSRHPHAGPPRRWPAGCRYRRHRLRRCGHDGAHDRREARRRHGCRCQRLLRARASAPLEPDTVVRSHLGPAAPNRTIGDWLNTAAYEAAGRAAKAGRAGARGRRRHSPSRRVAVRPHWRPFTCALSEQAATVPLGVARPSMRSDAPARRNAGPAEAQ